jgi:nitrate/nitrite transport system substrate-binding protein
MRDGLANKVLDAAHMLAPMVVASAAGLGPYPGVFATAYIMNLNGNAITVSNAIFEQIQRVSPDSLMRRPMSAHALKLIIDARKANGEPPLVFAHVYHYSMHAYELRYWLASAGIDPDADLNLIVVSPSQMVDSLRAGEIDGFVVGEPWNNAAVMSGLGRTLITSSEIWSSSPEKVLAVRQSWAEREHDIHIRLIQALLEASEWLDIPTNRITAAQIISDTKYVDVPFDEVVGSLTGKNRQTGGILRQDIPDFNVFHRYAANFPWRSQAAWILDQMQRWGQVEQDIDSKAIIETAFLTNVYREAAQKQGIAYPTSDYKLEGAHEHAWLLKDATQPIAMGADMLFDGRVFSSDQN